MLSHCKCRPARPRPKNRHRWPALSALGLAAALAVGCAAPAEEDEAIVLTFAEGHAATHPIPANGTLHFLAELEETGPEVGLEIEYYPGEQLGKFGDAPTMLSSGIADITAVVPAYLSEKLPMSSAFDLPGYTSDACLGAAATRQATAEGSTLREEELDRLDARPLWGVFFAGYEVMTSDVVEDPKGQRGAILRSPGGAVDRVVDEMGGAGVSMPLGEMYEAIERGTVEGTVASPLSMAPYGLADVLQHSTIGADLGAVTVLYMISEEQWSLLNEEQRTVITEAAESAERNLCEYLNELLPDAQDLMEEDGTELNRLKPAEQERWNEEVSAPAREQWQSDLTDMGLPVEDVLEEWESALAEQGVSDEW